MKNEKKILLASSVLIGLALISVAGRPLESPQALSLEHNGVHAPYTVRNKKGELLFYNFRAVEPKVVYRGSGFVRNRLVVVGGVKEKRAAAYADGQAFEFLRARNIKTIIFLQPTELYYGEKGYFDYWRNKTGYAIDVRRLSVKDGHAYDLNSSLLDKYPDIRDRRTGLRAAAEFLEFMKKRKPTDGAVYVHCDAGKDRTGVVVAAYEMWRNRGLVPANILWDQVMKRYLVSNVVIDRDKEAARFAGGKNECGDGEDPDYVCSRWLNKVRPQLEVIAQL